MKKIVFLINSLAGGGAERVVCTLSNYFASNNDFEVTIVTLEDFNVAYDLDEKINLIKLRSLDYFPKWASILALPLLAFEFLFIKKKIGCDLSMSFLVRSNFVNILSNIFSTGNAIISERNNSLLQYRGRLSGGVMRLLIRSLYPKASKIICISKGLESVLTKNFNIPANKLVTIHNPQKSQCSLVKRFSFRDQGNFLNIGRLINQKNHESLIRIFADYHSLFPRSTLTILGDGPLRSKLEEMIITLGLFDSVFLPGFVKNTSEYYLFADAFLFTSRFEGFGNVLPEAMSYSLPIIAFDCASGPAEILDDGKYGTLIKIGDQVSFLNAMIALQDPVKYRAASNKAYLRSKDFDVEKTALKYLDAMSFYN